MTKSGRNTKVIVRAARKSGMELEAIAERFQIPLDEVICALFGPDHQKAKSKYCPKRYRQEPSADPPTHPDALP